MSASVMFQQLTDCVPVCSVPRFASDRFNSLVACAPAAVRIGHTQAVFTRAVVVIPCITFLRIHLNRISRPLEIRCVCIEDEVVRKLPPFIARTRGKPANCSTR